MHGQREHRQLRKRSVRHDGHWFGNGEVEATTGGGGGTTVSDPTCPNYVPYSTEFPGQDGGPPPAGATQPGAWYVNTCATGSATKPGHRRGVVRHRPGAPHVPPPDPAVVGRPGGQ